MRVSRKVQRCSVSEGSLSFQEGRRKSNNTWQTHAVLCLLLILMVVVVVEVVVMVDMVVVVVVMRIPVSLSYRSRTRVHPPFTFRETTAECSRVFLPA